MRHLLVAVVILIAATPLRAQVNPPQSETVALDNPIEPRLKLVLEDAYRPGTKVSLDEYKGKIVLLRAAVPE